MHFPLRLSGLDGFFYHDITDMIVCRPDVIGPTLTVLCCIFLVPCKFVYLNLAFADWTIVDESEHGMFEKELKCPTFEH